MSVIPDTRIGQIEFYETHLPAWTINAAAIGLTPADVTAFTAKVTAARASFGAAEIAREAARSSTVNFYAKVADMQDQGADFVRTIRAYAGSKNDPNVYVLAQIPPPAVPGPTPPPGTPSDFRVALLPTGGLSLRWACKNPAGTGGTIYEIGRKIGSGGAVTQIGSTGVKSFTDETVPSSAAAAGGVTYQITAVRSTSRGTTSQFTVSFGVGGVGGAGMVVEDSADATAGEASPVTPPGMKMAA